MLRPLTNTRATGLTEEIMKNTGSTQGFGPEAFFNLPCKKPVTV